MDLGSEKARSVVEQATQAGSSLNVIAGAVSRIHEMSTQIASATEQQIAVNEEINQSVININDMAKQTSAGAQETASASEDLAHLAQDLNSLVGQFKV